MMSQHCLIPLRLLPYPTPTLLPLSHATMLAIAVKMTQLVLSLEIGL